MARLPDGTTTDIALAALAVVEALISKLVQAGVLKAEDGNRLLNEAITTAQNTPHGSGAASVIKQLGVLDPQR